MINTLFIEIDATLSREPKSGVFNCLGHLGKPKQKNSKRSMHCNFCSFGPLFGILTISFSL